MLAADSTMRLANWDGSRVRLRWSRIAFSPAFFKPSLTGAIDPIRLLRVRKLQPPLQLAPQDPVFSSQILIPQQQLLVHRPRNVGQDTCPLHESPPICPPIRAGALDRPKKPSGRHAARLRRDGITARLSCSFNFLATRDASSLRKRVVA